MRLRARQFGALAPLLALFAAAIAGVQRVPPAAPPPVTFADPVAEPLAGAAYERDVDDLSGIRFRREFRILVAPRPPSDDRVPGTDTVAAEYRALVEKFADEQFLLPVWTPVSRWQDLTPALLRGEGDLISPYLRIRDYRARKLAYSVPVGQVQEVLVARSGDRVPNPSALAGREIAIREHSTFWPELARLRRQGIDVQVRIIDDQLPPEIVLQRVLSMRYDMAVLDSNGIALNTPRWSGLTHYPGIGSADGIAFGLHPAATELKTALDDFLTREQLAKRETVRRTDDLEGIVHSGVLRVLTRNNAGSYFIWRGRPLGFEYELIGKFADELGVSLDMVVAKSRDRLLPALMDGEGDVVAAGVADTARRRALGAAFTRPYKESYELVITRANDLVQTMAELEGRRITVRRSSPVWSLLDRLRRDGAQFELEAAPEDLETEAIIERVANGLYDVTVADAYSAKVAMTWRDDVRAAFAVDGPVPIAWAVRESNGALLAALNEFLDREYRQLFFNIIYSRYFENPRRVKAHVTQRADNRLTGGQLSPYDDIVRRHAATYGFDWPLIVALMYRESRFDPQVVSWAGARGLMQVLPVTARRFGVTDLENPESAIFAGVRMLDWLYQQMNADLPVKIRTWFSLAAYNAGLGHLLDARRLARKQGLDPNRWFGNVEKAMLLLSKPKYYRAARHGYVRGIEPVTYVREIRQLYNAYRSMLHQ